MEIGCQLFVFAIILTLSSVSAGKCRVCESNNDTKCIKDPGSLSAEKDCDASKCFTLIESNGNFKRGCVSDTVKCDGKNCKPCDATDAPCNIQTDLFWCKTCDSSSDPDCAYWKNENSVANNFCDSGVSKCFMEIKSDKHTSRRCAAKSDEVCSNDKCSVCSDASSCNKGIFPSDRLKCYQCNSDDSKCATPTKYTSEILSFPCLFYEEKEKCFEHGSSSDTSTSMSRGCLSDTSAYGKCTSENPKEKCKECNANGCNVDEYKVESTVKCVQCKSDDANCAKIHKVEDATACSSKIEYWKPQGCYINKIDTEKVAKGCIQDFDCSSASCTSCTSGSGCNTGDLKDTSSSCYKCRSDDNPKCVDKLADKSYEAEKCRNAPDASEANQCYVERWNDIVIRSCLADADAKTRKNCLDTNYKRCDVCKGDNCNSEKAPNSGNSMALASGLIVISALALKFF